MLKEKKKIIFAFVALAVILVVLIFWKQGHSNTEGISDYTLSDELVILNSGNYSGAYVEDGTNENLENVAAITVYNKSDKWLEYAQIFITIKSEVYEFSVSALPAGGKAVLLEKGRRIFTGYKNYNIELKNDVFYAKTPSLYKNKFKIMNANQQITVKNIGEKDISGDIYVYYKTKYDDTYLGGIAYRSKIEGGLDSKESKPCYAGHFNEESSEILFITYVE